MSLDYGTTLNDDLGFIQFTILDYDNINIYLTISCGIKYTIINNYQDILGWENIFKIPFENYYREYVNNNPPPETFNSRESVYDYANSFLNGIDFITYPNINVSISANKYDSENEIFYDVYSKNIIENTNN